MNKTLQLHLMSVSQLVDYADHLINKKEALDELLYEVLALINTNNTDEGEREKEK